MNLLYISESETKELMDMDTAIGIVEKVFRWYAEDRIETSTPGTSVLRVKELNSRYRVKACSLNAVPVVGIRMVGYHLAEDGSGSSSPDSTRFVLLSDPTNGKPLALIDEHWNYSLRTCASAALGIKYLARKKSKSLGIVGAGLLARTIVPALCKLFPVSEIRVTSRRPASREAFAKQLSKSFGVEITPVSSVEECVRGSDIVVTATTSEQPLVKTEWISTGCCICTLGRHELEPSLYAHASKVVVDSWNVSKEVPDVKEMLAKGIFSESKLYGEMHQLVTGEIAGRESPDEIIIIRSEGLVTQDTAIAYEVYKRAVEKGKGTPLGAQA